MRKWVLSGWRDDVQSQNGDTGANECSFASPGRQAIRGGNWVAVVAEFPAPSLYVSIWTCWMTCALLSLRSLFEQSCCYYAAYLRNFTLRVWRLPTTSANRLCVESITHPAAADTGQAAHV